MANKVLRAKINGIRTVKIKMLLIKKFLGKRLRLKGFLI